MEKIKVLLIAEAMSGGVRRHVVDLIQNIDVSKFDVTLLYGTGRMDEVFLAAKSSMVQKARLVESKYMQREVSLKTDRLAYREVKDLMAQIRPDVVHCHSSKAGILGRMAAKKAKVGKVFYTPHAYSFQAPEFTGPKNAVFTFLERYFSRHNTTKTFNVSVGEKQCALDRGIDKEDKFTVIYNGIPDIAVPDKMRMRAKLHIPENAFVAGVTARLGAQKDPLTFVKIAKEVLKSHPDSHFVYIGDGPLYDQVASFIAENNLGGNVHLLGFRDDADEIVAAFDVYLLTSLYEGLPYSPIESMRADVPIVATRATGNTELVTDGLNGRLFDIGNVRQAAALLDGFISGKEDFRGKARGVFEERFTIEAMVKAIEKEYCS